MTKTESFILWVITDLYLIADFIYMMCNTMNMLSRIGLPIMIFALFVHSVNFINPKSKKDDSYDR